jgi:hypothetical protein
MFPKEETLVLGVYDVHCRACLAFLFLDRLGAGSDHRSVMWGVVMQCRFTVTRVHLGY